MIYKLIDEYYFNIQLDFPLENSKKIYDNREGYVIKLYLDDYCGYGEASPLPLFSKESFDQVVWALEELKKALKKDFNYSNNELFDLFNIYTSKTPSLHFALDIALYDILSQKSKIPISKYIEKDALDIINFSSIYNGSINNNSGVIKVKFGLNDIDIDLNRFDKIASSLPNSTIYRIDANGAYDIDDATYLCNKIRKHNIQYIEEPLLNMCDNALISIKNHTDIPIAIDESVINADFCSFIDNKLIDYVVFKASLFGGINKIKNFSNYLFKNNINIILSSALHTQIGNMSNIHIAAFLKLKDMHGLNNYSFFNYDRSLIPYSACDKYINLKSLIGLGASHKDS